MRRFDLPIQLWGSEQYSLSYGPHELGCLSGVYSIKMRDRRANYFANSNDLKLCGGGRQGQVFGTKTRLSQGK
jgi:hypothetical protein